MHENRPSKAAHSGRRRRRVRTDGAPRLVAPRAPGNRRSDCWAIAWSEAGRAHYRSTNETDEALARVRLAEFLNAAAAPRRAVDVNTVLDFHLEEVARKHLAAERGHHVLKARKSALREVRAHFGLLAPEEIEPGFVDAYVTKRRETVGDRTISIELAYLRSALNYALKKRRIEAAPAIELPAARAKARTRVIKRTEFDRLRQALRAAPLHLRIFVLISIYTGQRGVHVRRLRWEHVDLAERWIYFTESNRDAAENKQCADARIPAPLLPHLEEARKAARSPFVIEWEGKPVASLKKAWSTLCTEAKLADLHIHDLRRSFATIAAQNGIPLEDIAGFMNLDKKTLRRHYAHAAVSDAFVRAIDAIVDEAPAAQPAQITETTDGK